VSSSEAVNPKDWRSILGAIYAGVVALFVVNTLPAFVGLIGAGLKWDDRAFGLFASADVAGITVGSLAGVPLVRRFALRTIAVWGLVVLSIGDLGCGIGEASWSIISARFIGGVASGLVLAACYAVYSSGHAQRNFAVFCVGQTVSGFLGVTVLPLLASAFGWRSAAYSLAGLTLLAVPLSWYMPSHPYVKNISSEHAGGSGRSSLTVWGAVAGMVIYIIGEGAVWTFVERMGADSGVSEHNVNIAVSVCTLAGIIGAIISMFPNRRAGVALPLTVSALLSACSVCLIRTSSPLLFIIAAAVFNLTWLTFATIQFGVIAEADTAGTATISTSAAWYAGFAIGPYLAGELVVKYGFLPVQYFGVGGVLIGLLSLLPLLGRNATGPVAVSPGSAKV
jgi:predicted MFS family arabinose efflux permease